MLYYLCYYQTIYGFILRNKSLLISLKNYSDDTYITTLINLEGGCNDIDMSNGSNSMLVRVDILVICRRTLMARVET